MSRLPLTRYLNLIAGIIALGILALAAQVLWDDHQRAWQEAEQSSKNLLTAVARDLTGNIGLLDLSLTGVIEDLKDPEIQRLAPEIRHRVLFDRAETTSYMGSILILDETGNVVADATSVTPRSGNFGDRDYFRIHKDQSDVGLYVSRPFNSRLRSGDLSIAISRRLSHSDGKFAGVVMAAIPLSKVQRLFKNLNVGWAGTINLFHMDGVLLVRKPFDQTLIGQGFNSSPLIQHLSRESSGTFEAASPIDGVRRLISFERLKGLPLALTVAVSRDEISSAWQRKAIILSIVTTALCSAVVGLTFLFQRELRRRTNMEAKLARLARIDDLTDLPNRRAFRETFEREWRQAIRSGTMLSVLYIDVDSFKKFNDRYGHSRGDEALNGIANVLNASIRRPRDIAARHGGEEFAVMLPETDPTGARLIADTIRHAVMELGIAHAGSVHRVVTVSIGVASVCPSRGGASTILLEAADLALYQAKAGGRNCVREAEEGEPAFNLPAQAHAAA